MKSIVSCARYICKPYLPTLCIFIPFLPLIFPLVISSCLNNQKNEMGASQFSSVGCASSYLATHPRGRAWPCLMCVTRSSPPIRSVCHWEETKPTLRRGNTPACDTPLGARPFSLLTYASRLTATLQTVVLCQVYPSSSLWRVQQNSIL